MIEVKVKKVSEVVEFNYDERESNVTLHCFNCGSNLMYVQTTSGLWHPESSHWLSADDVEDLAQRKFFSKANWQTKEGKRTAVRTLKSFFNEEKENLLKKGYKEATDFSFYCAVCGQLNSGHIMPEMTFDE